MLNLRFCQYVPKVNTCIYLSTRHTDSQQPNYFQTLMEFTKFLSNINYLLVNNFCVVEFYHPKRKQFHAGIELLIYRTFNYNTYTNSHAKKFKPKHELVLALLKFILDFISQPMIYQFKSSNISKQKQWIEFLIIKLPSRHHNTRQVFPYASTLNVCNHSTKDHFSFANNIKPINKYQDVESVPLESDFVYLQMCFSLWRQKCVTMQLINIFTKVNHQQLPNFHHRSMNLLWYLKKYTCTGN